LDKAKRELELYTDSFNLEFEELDGDVEPEIRVFMDGELWIEKMKLK
jgi:hypothetical protein